MDLDALLDELHRARSRVRLNFGPGGRSPLLDELDEILASLTGSPRWTPPPPPPLPPPQPSPEVIDLRSYARTMEEEQRRAEGAEKRRKRPSPPHRIPDDRRAAIVEDRERTGDSVFKIAARHEVSKSTVARIIFAR